MADAVVKVNYNRAVVTIPGVGVAASMLAGKANADLGNVDSGVVSFTTDPSAPFAINLSLHESSDATSDRAALAIGSGWLLGQDSQGNGSKDLFLYGVGASETALRIDPDTNAMTLGGPLLALEGIGDASYLNTTSGDATPTVDLTATMAEIGVAGSNWFANHAVRRAYTSSHLDGRFTFATINKSRGSGGNSPSNGAFARAGIGYKEDYLTSTAVGEVGVDFLWYAQGVEGDGSAILIDGVKVGNVGGALGLETSTSTINAAGKKSRRVKSITAFIESGQVGGYGHLSESWVGQNKAAYLARNHDESAGEIGGPPSWEWLFLSFRERGTTDHNFAIAGDGTQIYLGLAANRKSLRVAGNVLQFRNAADDATLAALNDNGEWSGQKVGSGGSEKTFEKRLVASIDFPSIPAFNTQTVNVTVAGAAIGDHVSVCAAGTDYADDKLFFSGMVSAADTVPVRCHNFSSGAIDPASQTVSVVVSRYA